MMHTKIIIILISALLFFQPSDAGLFTNYQKMKPDDVVSHLQEKQIQDPNNAIINYNLGNALYKLGRYDQAKPNFERAIQHCGDDNQLRLQALFNAGNSCYRSSQNILGPDWEKEKLDQKILDEAAKEAAQAVEHFKRVLMFEPDNDEAKNNQKICEKLLSKLQKKKQQQQKDKEKQDQKDKDKQKQDQQQKDQKQDKQDQKKQNQKNKDNEKQDQQKNKDKQKKQDQKKQEQQKKQEKQKPEQAPAQPQKPQESMKKRGMRARLQDLQKDEANLQKKLIKLQSIHGAKQGRGQKPW